MKMLDAISSQMVTNYQNVQAQLTQTAADLQRVTQDNETFHREIRNELTLLWSSPQPQSSTPMVSSTIAQPTLSSVSLTPLNSSPFTFPTTSTSSSTPPLDFQAQMLILLNDTFSKLSTAITETKSMDTKSEWPKFSGGVKKFRTWYLAIVTQLSLSPWSALYDPVQNTVVATTTDTSLNSKFYAKLIASLEGQALQNMVARKHIRANGILLLRELQQMYRPKNVPEMIAAKTGEF